MPNSLSRSPLSPRPSRAAYAACGAVLALTTIACDSGERRRYEVIDWNAPVASGHWIRVRNTSGSVRVRRADGPVATVRVESRTRPRKSDLHVVIDSAEDGNYVVCAVLSRGARCDEEGYRMGSRSFWNRIRFMGGMRSPQADFTVLVPAGTNIDASSINGGITIEDASGTVVAKTVNGGIRADAGAATSFTATTVNGGITVKVDSLTGDGDLTLKTVNGSVTAELPPTLNADVHLETVNGRLTTDYPLTVNGKLNPRRLDATVGEGGRNLTIKTVNGSVRLAKRE
ncbi:MAG TPA: DUF4097 family beta strand repeat-containing protein [Gemmatimonadaceae bacterium]|nr:DUF4097 family beta strand repeat-containing protein [Gemmatimonadaceae bacterium]